MTTRDTTLASFAKVARGAGTNFLACIRFVKDLGNVDDTKDTFIENYAAGLLDLKAATVATLRLRAGPDAKPNAHGQRTDGEHKAIRAAEVAWVRVRNAAGFAPAKQGGQANNAKTKPKTAPTAEESKAKPQTLEAVLLPVMSDASDALAWLLQFSIKAKTFRNANAKLFDTFGENGMAIRDALASLTKAIDGAKAEAKLAKNATPKPTAQPKVVPASVAQAA